MDRDVQERHVARKRVSAYQVLIHITLVALAATVVGLTQRNQELREPPPAEGDQLDEGSSIQAFSALSLEGSSQWVDFAQGDKETLVFVFTTVCPACQENQGNWRQLYEESKGQYDILGISLNDLEQSVEYRETNDLPYSVVIPEDVQAFTSDHQIYQVPLTIRLDREGKVRGSWLGILDKVSLAQLGAA